MPRANSTDDRLYLGTATGSLQVYSFEAIGPNGTPRVELLRTHSQGKRPIDQIAVLPNTSQLVLLSGESVPAIKADIRHRGDCILAR